MTLHDLLAETLTSEHITRLDAKVLLHDDLPTAAAARRWLARTATPTWLRLAGFRTAAMRVENCRAARLDAELDDALAAVQVAFDDLYATPRHIAEVLAMQGTAVASAKAMDASGYTALAATHQVDLRHDRIAHAAHAIVCWPNVWRAVRGVKREQARDLGRTRAALLLEPTTLALADSAIDLLAGLGETPDA